MRAVKDRRRVSGLTAAQWTALALLADHERRLGRPLEAGDAGTYAETWQDSYTTGIHWRTAYALHRRGLVVVDDEGVPRDEAADVYLTDAGREKVARHE
jgi:hypothetical protein